MGWDRPGETGPSPFFVHHTDVRRSPAGYVRKREVLLSLGFRRGLDLAVFRSFRFRGRIQYTFPPTG